MAAFKSVGFYLHAGWVYRHPFAVRSWRPEDYAGMFQVLKAFGYDRVMMWPLVEAMPMPLSDADKGGLVAFRGTIEAGRKAGLDVWIAQCPNLTTQPSVAAKPWSERAFPDGAKTVRLDDPAGPFAVRHHTRQPRAGEFLFRAGARRLWQRPAAGHGSA